MAKDIDDEEIPFLCMASLNGTSTLWFLVVSNMFLAISSTLGNTVILAALSKDTSLHLPSKILLRSLALTDLSVGLFVEPLFVTFLISLEKESENICSQVIVISVFIDICFSLLSLLTLTATSVDRLLALLLA